MTVESGYRARWPLLFVVDARGGDVGWAAIGSQLVSPTRQTQFVELRRAGFRFVGMTNDGLFPATSTHDPLAYSTLCEAWCHCFRQPERYLPQGVPRIALALSDFTDDQRVAPERCGDGERFDIVYVGATEPWKQAAKNWPLAQRCLPVLCRELGMRALVVGAPPVTLAGVTCVPALPWHELLGHIARARLLFAPNAEDASPRVLAETLCLDRPILVHRDILGGWQYVNAFTGAVFSDERDVVAGARACLAITGSPRRWFRAHHGPYLAGQRLLALVRTLDPSISERSHLGLHDWLPALPTR